MASFIELTSTYNHPVLINVDSISYIEPSEDGSKIHLCVSSINSSENGGTLRSVSGYAQVVYVKESYIMVKRKVTDL